MNSAVLAYHWLPDAFAFLMGLSMLIYVITDGYDLGVGLLFLNANEQEKDKMVASIGPFWDANETWLVLGIGLLLVAFPAAHGIILSSLYLPTTLMLLALILRGVSFDFRTKVQTQHKKLWNRLFFIGSVGMALAQGYMLGAYSMGFENSLTAHLFSALIGLCVTAGYGFIGSCWLIMKTSDQLQKKAIRWAGYLLWFTAFGIALISISTPLINEHIFDKWFSMPNMILLAPIPLLSIGIVLVIASLLKKMPFKHDAFCWAPFAGAVTLFILCFEGLAYSFYPYIIPQKMTIQSAAASHDSLMIIFVGAMIVLPCILGYTFVVHRVFRGKLTELHYD